MHLYFGLKWELQYTCIWTGQDGNEHDLIPRKSDQWSVKKVSHQLLQPAWHLTSSFQHPELTPSLLQPRVNCVPFVKGFPATTCPPQWSHMPLLSQQIISPILYIFLLFVEYTGKISVRYSERLWERHELRMADLNSNVHECVMSLRQRLQGCTSWKSCKSRTLYS